ncbi:16S rRNA (guanine966-N2)-methyltransferase [Lentibacillus halodurans]|uniref:16S rRNA (Guanine966-N2)-methyltransferase n=1 Tax=Lentibacillus halodurans TaxID=237679 RepID=A0A1I0Z307_9BACI|nr:16S rRNA (guanine(966)-N(2))-methyltransferase RsmD [Lentibacillus halodurans]SFB18653.1 16S rRNA (guanine966-N2)-methyltransferase [Lentibacillus halodurans]
MRVVAGFHKGRQLEAVPGSITRPTADKVKEAVFQMMGPFFERGICLDLFAGSGGLGIEALSRGMDKGIFVDKFSKAIHTIHQNVRMLKLEDKVEIFRTDAFRALKAAAKRGLQFDLILLDPPYQKAGYGKLLNVIESLGLLKEDGMIYCEHESSEQLPVQTDDLVVMKQEIYNDTTGITIYRNK